MSGYLNESGFGQDVEPVRCNAVVAHHGYTRTKVGQIHQPGLKSCAVGGRIGDDFAVGGEG